MNRKSEQEALIFKLGLWMGPMLPLAENPGSCDPKEHRRIVARWLRERGEFLNAFERFTEGEPGCSYRAEYERGISHLAATGNWVWQPGVDVFAYNVKKVHTDLLDAIYSIPVDTESAIHDACTPFSTHCLVKNLCSTTRTRITWMDRYFDQTLFARYFVDTPQTTAITLVTYPPSKCTSGKDKQRHADFIGMSRLFATERGQAGYRLLFDDQFHDRYLQCDDEMFHLGGSIKDLDNDKTFTISKLDSTPENQKQFDEAIAKGSEVFGPSQANHP
jgi:hypothetical protein